MRTVIILAVFFVAFSPTFAQSKTGSHDVIEIPLEYGVVTTIDQRDSPVRFEELQLFMNLNGGFPQLRYAVRNKTSKTIAYLSVQFLQRSRVKAWGRYSDGWIENSGDETGEKTLITAGDVFESAPRVTGRMLGPKEALTLFDDGSGKAKAFTYWLGFVKRIRFSDGTEFISRIDGTELSELLQPN